MGQRLAEEDSVWDDDVAEEGTAVIVGIGDEATPADHDTVSCERGGQRSAIEVFCNELFGVGSAFDFSTPHGAREGSMALSCQTGAKNPTLMPGSGGFTSVYPRLRQALVQGWRRATTTGERVESACQDKEDDARSRQADGGQMSDDPQQAVANPVPPTPSEVLTASSVRMMLGMASALRTTNPEALQVICSTLFDLLLETPPLVLAPLRQSPSSLEATTFRKVGEFCAELLGSANHAEHQPALRLYLALAVSKGEVSGLLEVVHCFLDRARLDAEDGGTPALFHFPGGATPSSTVAAVDTAKPERGQCRDRDAGVSAVLERLANQRVNFDPPFPSPRDDGPCGWKEVLRNLVDDSERTLKGSASRYSIPPLRETAVFVLAHLDRLGAHYLCYKGERAQAGEVGSPISSLQKRGLDFPFCFDLAPETFRHLVDLVERSAGSIEKVVHGEDDDREEKTTAVSEEYLEQYVLSASLRLLNVNIGILLGSGLGVEEFGGEGLRRSLLQCLLGLVRHCETHWTRADFSSRATSIPHTAGQVGRGKAAEEALRLLVDGMDLFYPSQGLQASLLSSYLRAFWTSSESHTTASHALVLELLCRTSTPEFLRSFLPERRHPTPSSGTSAHGELLLGPGLESCEESPRSLETLDSFADVLLESSSAQAVKEVRHAAGMVSVGCDSAPGAESVLMSDKLRESSKEVGQAVLRALDAVLNLRCVDAFQAAKEGRVEGVDSTADIRKFLLLVLQASSNVLAAAIEARCCATAADVFERVVEAVCNGLVGTLLPSCLASALALPVDATDLLREPLQQYLVQLTRTLGLLTMAACAPHGSAQRSPSVQLKDEIGTLQADFGVEALGQEALGSEGGVGATTEHRSTKEGNKHPEARPISTSKLSANSRILARVERLCSALGASLVRRMVVGEPRTAQEKAHAQWLVHPLLLHAEVNSGRRERLGNQQDHSLSVCDTTVTTPPQPRARGEISKVGVLPRKLSQGGGWVGMSFNPSAFVQQLSMNPSSRKSRALSRAMRRVVLQDRGGDPATNDVVWSVALAAVYHAGLAGELAEVARAEIIWAEGNFTAENVADSGAPMNPSPALVRAWRSAQTTRARLTRGTRALVLQRARFLLFLEPWVSMRRVKRQDGSPHDVSFARALKGSELVLECLLSPVETASARDGGGGVNGAEDKCAVHYVDAREADQGCLLHIIDARSERATTRARGFELAAQLLDGTSSDRATADVLRAVADGLLRAGSQWLEHINPEGKSTHQALDKCATNEEHETTGVLLPPGQFAGEDFGQAEPNAGRLHFVPGTECCDPKCKLALVESVAGFLSRCSIVLGQERIGDRGSAGNRLTRPFVLVHALRAVSMDYEFHDHDLIQRSQLLPLIASLVDDTDRSVAAEASRALQAVYRCAAPAERGMSDAMWERVGEGAGCTSQRKATRDGSGTPFQVSFFGTVRSMLERTAEAIGTKTPGTLNHKLVEDEKTPTAGTPALHIESMGGGAGCALSGERMLSGEMEERAAQVLALAHACCRVECGRRELANEVAVRALLRLVLLAKPEIRGWALRVCRMILPWVAPRLVHDEFRCIVRERQPSFEGSFVECALLLVGQIAGVWTTLEGGASEIDSDPPASPPTADKGCALDMFLAPAGFRAWRERVPARDSFSLSSELVSLLHELAAGADTKGAESAGKRPSDYLPAWQEEVATVVCRCLQRAGPIVESLQRHKMLEETRLWAEAARARGQLGLNREGATSDAVIEGRDEAEPTPPSADDVDRLVAVLCLLGGQFEGLYPGGRVLCRLPPGESSSDIPGGWEDRATVEATVLRLPFAGTKSPGGNSNPVGDLPADETTSADGGSGDGAGSGGVESAEGQRHMASRLCSARLLPRPAGCTRPLDVFEGLADEGFSRGAEASTAVARQVHEQRRLERQQRLMQEHRALSLRMQGARFGRVSRPHGQGRINVGGEQPLPIVGQSVLLSRSRRGEEGMATTDNPAGGGSVSASASSRRQQPVSACEELVTVGFSRDDRGIAPAPRAFTVPVDSVTLVHKGVPGALVRTLTSYAQEFLPGLKAMLEAETTFRGPTYAQLQSASSCACTVESAHPYQPGEDHMWPISVSGAETVELSFDPMSRVARPEDHIALSWRTPSGGSGHRRVCPCSPANHSSGRGGPRPCEGDDGGSQAWPGVGAEPPLLVMAGELTVRFVTDIALDANSAEAGAETSGARPTATRAWGFRLTAVSPKVPPKTPRPQPPSNARATLCDLRARASLGLASLLEHGEMSARLAPVLPVLVKAALGAASEVAIGGDIPGAGTPQPWLERRLARAYALLHRQRGPPSRLPEADFVQFPYSVDAAPPPQRDTLGESSTVATSADRLVTSPSTDSCSSSTAPEAGYVGGAPPLEQISSTAVGLCSDDPWPRRYVVCIGGVAAFDKPKLANGDGSSSRQLARLRHGATVAVVAQQRDWLKVIYDSKAVFTPTPDDQLRHSTSLADFWVRQRQDDTFFLMPEALAGKELDMEMVPDCPDLGSKEGGEIVSMLLGDEYDDEEDARFASLEGEIDRTDAERKAARSTEGWDAATTHSPGDVGGGTAIADDDDQRNVEGQTGGALWASTVDTLCAATATYGVSALLAVAARWQGGAGKPSYLDLFGSARSLWELLRLTSVIEKGDLQSAAFSTLKQHVGERVASEGGGALGGCLTGHALGALRNLAAQPRIKAVARVFETPHPYQNNMNVEWDVYLPEAKRIKVVFDPRSRTETSCDWVDIILQDPDGAAVPSRLSRGRHHRFHGRGGRENFPGFGGRLPLWLEGNRFVARFQSDPTATDWGVRFTAYGILDCDGGDSSGYNGNGAVVDGLNVGDASCGPTNGAAQGVAAPAPTGIVTGTTTVAVPTLVAKGRAGAREVELCCWVLDLLSREGHAVPEVASLLCDNSALEAFEACLKTFSQERRLSILRLITGIVARVGPAAGVEVTAAGSSAVADSQNSRASARPSYADTCRLLQAVLSLAETQRAIEDGCSVASPYLQGLVECIVVLRNFLVDFADWPKSPGPEEDRLGTPPWADHAAERDAKEAERHCGLSPGAETANASPVATRESPKALERKLLGGGGAGAEAVEDVVSIWSALRDFSRGTAPRRLLVKDFLPMLTEACSVVVQSAHPFDRLAQRRVVLVPGAVGVQVRFDHRTEMRQDDRIVIRDPARRQPVAGGSVVATTLSQHADSSGIGKDSPMVESCNLLRDGGELGFSGLSGGRSDDLPLVSVGDHVVRGPDWAFGDEDCSGRQQQGTSRIGTDPFTQASACSRCSRPRIGIVVALEKWGERDGAGVRVQWATEQMDTAAAATAAGATRHQGREGFEALYCVQNPAHVRVVERGGEDRARRPIVRAGSSVEIEVVPGASGKGDGTTSPPSGGQSDAHLFRFDGESTHVDLPSYRGMRLEGDFTLEVWAWLDLGCAHDGKTKCVVSRVLHQPYDQGRPAAKARRSPSGEHAMRAPSSLATAAGSEQPGSPPPAHVRVGADESSEDLAWSSPVSPHEVRSHTRSATGPSIPGGVVAAGAAAPPRVDGDLSPMEGTRLVSPPASSPGNAHVGVKEVDRHGADEVGRGGAGWERVRLEKGLTSASGAVNGFADGGLPQPLLPSGGTRAGDNERGDEEKTERYACGEESIFVEGDDGIEESEDHENDGEVREDNGRANSYEADDNGKLSLSFEDALPSAPQDVVISSVTDSSIKMSWSPPTRVGRPALHSYIICLDDVEIASVGADTLEVTNINRPPGSLCSYSVAARGAAGTSPCCAPVVAGTTTEDDTRTQLALWVGGRGEIEFSMENERGKGVLLGAGQFREGMWTHMAVSVEGRRVSMFVDGERRASGTFVGHRLFSGSPSLSAYDHQHQHQHRRPSAEPLRLGSRGAQDFWRGRLCGMRVWGAASQAVDIRRRISSLPSASLVRPAPPSSFGVEVPGTQKTVCRLRLHAPLPDPSDGEVYLAPPGAPVRGRERKAYYEVVLRSGGCMQIGWALPSSCPSSHILAVGADDKSWAVDGKRSAKWHGNVMPAPSPAYAHGVPYGADWEWAAGDTIGCAVDLDEGVMSFSHNGRNLGEAFNRATTGRGVGRYRVIAPRGVECRLGVDEQSPVVETYPAGTVLQVSRLERLSRGGRLRLRTTAGWVAERDADDPDNFHLERLERDTSDSADYGTGPERCVFVDVLRSASESAAPGRGREGCLRPVTPPHECKDIAIGEGWSEVVATPEGSADGCLVTAAHTQDATPGKGQPPPTRSLLTRGVNVGTADVATFFIELFVPACEPAATDAFDGGRWAWGVVLADFNAYLTTQCRATSTTRDGGGRGGGGSSGEETVAPGQEVAIDGDKDRRQSTAGGSLHVVVDGPGGVFHAIPVCSAFRGRWMNMRIVAHRSGESLLVCTPGAEQAHDHQQATDSGATSGIPWDHEDASVSTSTKAGAGHHQRRLRYGFSNPRFFRGDRLGSVSLYSERSRGDGVGGYPFLARHAAILLGSLEHQLPPALQRLRDLERLVLAAHRRRMEEPTARPSLVLVRQRLRQIWSGEVPPPVPHSTTAGITTEVGASAATANGSPPQGRTTTHSTLTVWHPLLSPGRVALGTTVSLSRNGTGTTTPRPTHGNDEVAPAQRRSVTAWEHPGLQTPARFDPVPLSAGLSTRAAAGGRGLWAWAPVPRSKAFLAMGLVFTAEPEPPSLTDVRCARKELVVNAQPHKCKAVTLQRTTEQPGEQNSVEDTGQCCEEIIIVEEMGVCVPKNGSAWGLSPRVVLGDTGTNLGQRQPRWDDLMPSISGTAGQGMVVNIGHLPFRYPMNGYAPVSQVAHADARFVLQVYDDANRMWQDVRPSHGLMDGRAPPRAPELIGSWSLCARTNATDTADCRYLANYVFVESAAHTPPPSAHNSSGGDGRLVRLPPARAGGTLEAAAPGGPPMPKEEHEVWGLSLTVSPLFPSEFADAHPWLGQRFETFAALVWGEQGQALASNAELVRYVNAVASRKGLSKEALLTCDWAALQPPGTDLADWPLLQSMAASRTAATVATASVVSPRPSSGDGGGGVEETKQSDPPGGARQGVVAAIDDNDGRYDEWVVAKAVASGPERRGVRVRKTPVEYGNVLWRLPSGQAARLLPPLPPPPGGRGTSESSTGGAGWRHVRGAGGDTGWLPIPSIDATGSPVPSPLERVWARRFILDWFSPEAAGWPRGEEGDNEGGLEARAAASSLDVKEGAFWLPLRRRASAPAAGGDDGAAVRSPSPISAAHLLGNSDALLLSAVDAGGGDDRGTLLVTGKWTVGLVTDMLTVTTRTSGCTRIEVPPVARDGSASSVGGKAEQTADPLPVLVDGLVLGFRAVDGLLVVARAFPTAAGAGTLQHGQRMEQQALAWLGGLDEGAEVSFSIVDSGQDVVFSCREVGAPRRTATVRAKCRDTWGRGRVALGCRSVKTESSTSGWVRVTSQAHGATVRSGRSIDADGVVGRIPCGTVVPFDSAVLYHSPGAPDRVGIEPVIRYRCLATATTPAGWISERGRYANHPYRICEQILARPQQTPASISHVSVARVQSPASFVGGDTLAGRSSFFRDQPLPPVRKAGNAGSTAGETPVEEDQQRRESEWQQRLGELAVLPTRFHLLQQLNRGVSEVLRYVDLSQGDLPWSVAGLLSRCRHLVFFALRQEAWQAELARTSRPPPAAAAVAHSSGEATPPSLELRLSRGRAARHAGSGTLRADQKGRQTLFCQAFFSLRNTEETLFRLRPGEVLYSTVFVGEHAHDAGGPYRESFAEYCAELQSGALPLLIKCPNSVNDVGINREKWLPNPAIGNVGPSAALHAEMLGFLGRLMGVAIRSQEPLDLDLPSIVWKQLVRSPITRDDLEAVDFALTQSLKAVRNIHLRGVATDEAFRDLGLGGFEVATADGGRAGLPTPGGAAREVTLDNRLEFADMAEEFKMREYRVPVEAIRRGLASVVPIEHLRLFSWGELEVFVCGRKEVDVDLLEARTEYTLCCRQDSHVSAFWDVLRSFSPREKSLFLRFAWGRSRLPLSADQFHQAFKIQAFARTPADAYLPVAHTCFFSLELPRYSSREVLETKLRYAISNCRAMDADDTSVGRTAAGLGWGGDP